MVYVMGVKDEMDAYQRAQCARSLLLTLMPSMWCTKQQRRIVTKS